MKMKIDDDVFVHFTTNENAENIIEDGVIKKDPDDVKCFGAPGAFAVSLTYGKFYDSMVNHNEDRDGNMKAIVFTTDTKPETGFNEEVRWEQDINLNEAFICSYNDAKNALENSEVEYECDHLENDFVSYP